MSNEQRIEIPASAPCPNCGRLNPKLLSQLASHRLADPRPEQPYQVTFTLECTCGAIFTFIVTDAAGD